MKLRLHQLSGVSNNSILTNQVLAIFNDKLDDADRKKVYDWLRLVEQEQRMKSKQRSNQFKF